MLAMLAWLQRLIVFVLAAAAAGWAVALTSRGHPLWGLAGMVLILAGYALFLGIEFAMLWWMQDDAPVPRPRFGQILVAWWGEVRTAPLIFFWRQPFRSSVQPDNLIGAGRQQRGVVLVHGFFCNRGFWNPWIRRFRSRGIPFVAVNLEPLFGSIDEYPPIIETAVARLEAIGAGPVVIVGHSMGGLAIRSWLAAYAADARVRRVITVGTPHGGTWMARHSRTVNGRQMQLRSRWLEALVRRERPVQYRLFTCFYGHCDNIVFPSGTATLPGADNRHIAHTAHVQMAFVDAVFAEALHWLSDDASTAGEAMISTAPETTRSATVEPGRT